MAKSDQCVKRVKAFPHVVGDEVVARSVDFKSIEWEWEGCDLSDSILDIPLFLADLKAVNYPGFISIEDFRQMDHREKLSRQIEFLRSVD